MVSVRALTRYPQAISFHRNGRYSQTQSAPGRETLSYKLCFRSCADRCGVTRFGYLRLTPQPVVYNADPEYEVRGFDECYIRAAIG